MSERWLAVVIFGVTYVLISVRRLSWLRFDRPAAALLGAAATVVAGVLAPRAALDAINGETLLLLFGVMGMGAFLELEGGFERLEAGLVRLARTPLRLLGVLVWAAGLASAFITNDAVCLLGAPVLVRLIARHRLPALPFLLALATGANTGSVATLVGNPQNMLCGELGGLVYREHLALMAPVALVGLALNHGLLWLSYRKSLRGLAFVPVEAVASISREERLTLAVILGSAVVYMLGFNLAWTAVAGFVLLMLLHRRDTTTLWPRIDWSLLLFFTGLFIVVAGFATSGLPGDFFARFPLGGEGAEGSPAALTAVFLIGSNLVSNVPFILVVKDQMAALPNPRLGWELLAMAATFAGNLTLLGSVANLIVAEAGRSLGGIGYWQYLRIGFPLGVVTTALGALWLVFMLGS